MIIEQAKKTQHQLPKFPFFLVIHSSRIFFFFFPFCSQNLRLHFLLQKLNFNICRSSVKFNENTAARYPWHCMQQENYSCMFAYDWYRSPMEYWQIFCKMFAILLSSPFDNYCLSLIYEITSNVIGQSAGHIFIYFFRKKPWYKLPKLSFSLVIHSSKNPFQSNFKYLVITSFPEVQF